MITYQYDTILFKTKQQVKLDLFKFMESNFNRGITYIKVCANRDDNFNITGYYGVIRFQSEKLLPVEDIVALKVKSV